MRRTLFPFLLLLIVFVAGWVRSYDINWDEGTHLHPDERYLTMVASALELPASLNEYWDTTSSSLNPENRGYEGYVYGTLPLFSARVVGGWLDGACADDPSLLQMGLRRVLFRGGRACAPGHYTGYGGIHLVGRLLSVLADLLTLLALALLARLLFGDAVALLSAALYAFAVLPIQHAHFFVVDSFATVFVVWTLLFAVYAVESKRRWVLALAGLTTGLAVASKISTWPVAGMVGLAGLITVEEKAEGLRRYRFTLSVASMLALALSGLLAFVAFRAAQPYAFSGPGFFGLRLHPEWLESMRRIRKLVSGEVDTPPGHQWTDRLPILFPWRNMVVWGLGLPLGLAAWIGWGVMGWRILRRHDFAPLIPWLWGTLFFLYQGTQWVKSMRYLLPVYPVFVLFGAWVLLRGPRRALPPGMAERPLRRGLRAALRALPWVVLAGTVVWCAAFLQVYARPFTRVEASRWMYDHVPTAVSLHTETGLDLNVPVQPDSTLIAGGIPNLTRYTVPVTDTIVALTLNKVNAKTFYEQRAFAVALTSDAAGTQALTGGEQTVELDEPWSVPVRIPLEPLPVAAGDAFYVKLTLVDGAPVVLETSILGNEHWDDPLPVRLEGKDAFGNWYRGLPSSPNTLMNLYDNDTPAKRELLLTWLDDVDYIVLSSNRLYASIPRLPQRYPLTTTYYRALFDGSLGFELAAEFVAFPALGPCEFPDQEAPFPLPQPRYTNRRPCSVPVPPAEEAFSVYDHPRVLIFAKTDAYSSLRAEEVLAPSLVENVQWMTPLEATRGKGATGDTPPLVMSDAERAVQSSHGTWSKIFNREALHNRYPVLSVVLWWLALAVLGWTAFPWLTLAFPALRLRGYGFARIAGLLLWAYPAWLLASLKVVHHTRLLLWIVLFVWMAATALLVRSRRTSLLAFVRERWRDLLRVEIIFAILYLVWVLVRYLNPDLYHPVAGGEKPMDFAYLNAAIRSVHFPPYDPWFAGGFMNYYYFGFVLVGTLVEALGIVPAIAYNLAVPSLFAMTGVGAYTLASNLAGGTDRRARRAGIWGVLFMVVLGNLGELRLILKGLAEVGNISFQSLIPGYELLVSAAAGFWKVVVEGQELPFRPEWWYWNASRIVEPGPGEYVGPINEFPAFTFLYADLHAHAIALPLTQVALGVALQWGMGHLQTMKPWRGRSLLARLRGWIPRPLPTFLLAALAGGALRATNTWDYPTYLGLMSLGYLLPVLRDLSRGGEATSSEGEVERPIRRPFPYWRLAMPAFLLLAAELLFRPFAVNYASAYGSIQPWMGSKTPLGDYVIMHGQFLLPLALLGLARGARFLRETLRDEDRSVLLALIVVGLGTLVLTAVLAFLEVAIAWIAVPFGALAALIVLDAESEGREQTLWLWVGTALAITLTVEIVVLKGDIGRMNTVFKPYVQVWTLLATTAAVAMARLFNAFLWGRAPSKGGRWWLKVTRRLPAVGDVLLGLLLALLFAMALYPLFAIPGKIRDRWNPTLPPSLNGMTFMDYLVLHERDGTVPLATDAEVIRWLQENVEGSPVIMEKNAEIEYIRWGNRMSIYTGLPTVIGWRWHQAQQRMVMPPGSVEARQQDVADFYTTPDAQRAWEILEKHNVEYVVVTPYEELYMTPPQVTDPGAEPDPQAWFIRAEAKFDEMVGEGRLEVVFEALREDAVVYRVVRDRSLEH